VVIFTIVNKTTVFTGRHFVTSHEYLKRKVTLPWECKISHSEWNSVHKSTVTTCRQYEIISQFPRISHSV